jgi:hypothetical protein
MRTTNEKYPIIQMSPNETSPTSVPTGDGAKPYIGLSQNPLPHRSSDGWLYFGCISTHGCRDLSYP